MKSNYDRLGNHVCLVDQRNREGMVKQVLGININKYFMPSVANTIGTDLSNYKLLTKGLFACNPMHVGRDKKLPIALYNENTPSIVSPAYFVFKVIDNNVLNEEYLMMWFQRSEFDRVCWFKTDGSVRGGITWDDICRIELPILSYQEQLKIVRYYRLIIERIELKKKISDNLEATAQAYFDNLFFSCEDTNCTLADIALVNPSRPLSKGVEARCFDMATLPTSGCIPIGNTVKPYNGGVRFINGDTLIARITPCLENGKAAYINILDKEEVAFGSTEYIVFASKDNIPSCFYYFLIRNSRFVTFALQFMNGSSGRQRVSGEELAFFPLMKPSKENLDTFNKVGKLVLEQMKEAAEEIQSLKQLQEMITTTLSSC